MKTFRKICAWLTKHRRTIEAAIISLMWIIVTISTASRFAYNELHHLFVLVS